MTIGTDGPLRAGTQECSIGWLAHLTGPGLPMRNAATVGGETQLFRYCPSARVEFVADESPIFLRCDPNVDGQVDLADAVRILHQLFREGPVASCDDAADCNADGIVDVSDATFHLAYRFQAGPPPPPPFPDCDGDLVDDGLGCDEYVFAFCP